MGRFAGKAVVVTGSGRQKGLGQGILQAFADEGANCAFDAGKPCRYRHPRHQSLRFHTEYNDTLNIRAG